MQAHVDIYHILNTRKTGKFISHAMLKPIQLTPLLHRFNLTCIVVVLLLNSVSAWAAKPIRTIEGISEFHLSNGLQVLLFPDPSKDTITVNVTYRVGSKHENYGETGMAHLLEHLLFKGSKKFPDIAGALTKYGARANGSTWLERTNYYETLKATEDNLAWALAMEADRMVNSFVAQKDLDSEMTVVRNEFERGENSPSRILLQRIYSLAFDWHNYGKSTIGARSDIENVSIERLRAFYQNYYQPDNATLVIAGKFDREKALSMVNKTFGKIKKPKRPLLKFYTSDPTQDGAREFTLRRVGGDQVVAAAYKIPSGLHEDFAAIEVLSNILGNSSTGRLYKDLVENKLATYTGGWANQQKDASLMTFMASANLETDLHKTEKALLTSVENIVKQPFTELEIERAKRKILKSIDLAFNDSQNISIELSEWVGIGDWRMLFVHRDRLEDVTLQDVQRVAERYLISSNRTLGRFIPTETPKRAEIPATPNVAKIVEGYKGRKQITQGETFDASLKNIDTREKRSNVGGIKISTIPIKTRGKAVHLDLWMGFGNEKSLQNQSFVRDLSAAMLKRGTKRFTRETLQDEFDQLKAQGQFGADTQGIYARFETTRDNLLPLITLIHEVLSTASFPEKEFELLKAQRLSDLNTKLTDPQALAFRAIYSKLNHYPKGHIFYRHNIQEEIDAISNIQVSNLRKFHTQHFGGTDVHVAIVGDLDQENTESTIAKLFQDWQTKTPYKRSVATHKNANAKTSTIQTPDKKNAFFIAGRNLELIHNDDDAAALYVITRMLGGGFINSRLATRIRQNDGLSYTVASFAQIKKMDENGYWLTYAIAAPNNIEKVEIAFNEEMQRALDKGFSEEELRAAINGLLDEAKVNRNDKGQLAQTVRSYITDEFSIKKEIEIQDRIRELTVEDVNRVMRKYLDPKNMNIVKAGDFK
ncbi:MAG: insulinase family protein [Agarilytica sp.]